MKLLMISGDNSIVLGKRGAFFNLLEEFHKHWDRIDVICPKAKGETENILGNVFLHPSNRSRTWQWKFIVKKGQELFEKQNFDVMTVQEYPPFYNGLGAKLLHRKIKAPYLLEFHHIVGYPKAGSLKEKFYLWLTKSLVRWDVKTAAAVRVVNQKQTPEFLKECGVPAEKIKYISSFYLDFGVFREMNIPKECELVFAARLEKNKGIWNLIKAVEILRKQKSSANIKLLIIGDGSLKKKLQRYIMAKNLTQNVIFSGWLKTSGDVAEALNSAKIFVNPSFNEGGPRVLLEAMACGLPVVTTKVGVALDLIENGENGFFSGWSPEHLAERIGVLLNDENLRQKISVSGKQAVQQFDKKAMIENYTQAIKAMIQ